jgi:hypothetical protein
MHMTLRRHAEATEKRRLLDAPDFGSPLACPVEDLLCTIRRRFPGKIPVRKVSTTCVLCDAVYVAAVR